MHLRFDRAEGVERGDAKTFTARVARTGPHVYSWGTERRDSPELHRVAAQLAGKPVVIQHPTGLMSEGASASVVGRMVRGWVDGDYAVAEIRVDDSSALDTIKKGMRELSLGYSTNPDAAGYQRDTKVDHLAIVDKGKCGSACTLRADTCDCGCVPRLQDSDHDANIATAKRAVALTNQIIARKTS